MFIKRIIFVLTFVFQITACTSVNYSVDKIEMTENINNSAVEIEATEKDEDKQELMFNKLHYTLPDELVSGEFDLFLGNGGGIPLYKTDDTERLTVCGGIALQLGINGIFENGELVRVNSITNYASYSEFESCPGSVPCVITLYSRDVFNQNNEYSGEESIWYAFWAVENCMPVYSFYLHSDYFEKEDLKKIISSVKFPEADTFTPVSPAAESPQPPPRPAFPSPAIFPPALQAS